MYMYFLDMAHVLNFTLHFARYEAVHASSVADVHVTFMFCLEQCIFTAHLVMLAINDSTAWYFVS